MKIKPGFLRKQGKRLLAVAVILSIVATLLVLTDAIADGWVFLKAGSRAIDTFVASVSDLSHPLVLAVLVGGKDESLSSSLNPLRDRINLMTR